MPLIQDGDPVKTPTGVSARAKNQNGQIVIVKVSIEATQDYECYDIWDMASKKYDNGVYDQTKLQPIVSVTTKDFQG